MTDNPQITKLALLGMQVCVPSEWVDSQVEKFANSQNPPDSELWWSIRKQGHEMLKGCDERVPCDTRDGYVHIMLEP